MDKTSPATELGSHCSLINQILLACFCSLSLSKCCSTVLQYAMEKVDFCVSLSVHYQHTISAFLPLCLCSILQSYLCTPKDLLCSTLANEAISS